MNEIVIYTNPEDSSSIEVKLDSETVWLNQHQLAHLFSTDRSSINRHIRNIYNSGELDRDSTCAKIAQVQREGNRLISRDVEHFNLDLIISVGYRVNSKRGIQFRKWASQRLKDYLLKGYALNENRLREQTDQIHDLKEAVRLISEITHHDALGKKELKGIIDILSKYTRSLITLEEYDEQRLNIENLNSNITYAIDLEDARNVIRELRLTLKTGELFGNEKDKSFGGLLKNVIQTWEGKYLYPTIEEQAAHLLYFTIKNHPFTDGNKRIGAFLFVYFLEKNNHRLTPSGEIKINANGLAALALLVAQSLPEDKDNMIKLIVNMIR